MDQNSLLTVMTVFVVVAGLALLVQMGVMIGLYKAARSTEAKLASVLPQVEALVQNSHRTLNQGREQLLEITGKSIEILDSVRVQMSRVDEVMADATHRARVQLEKAELVIDDTLNRAQQTVGLVHSGVLRPLREIQGVTVGVKAAIAHLARSSRPPVHQITHDEEMFI
jgi:uncharacterized membrane-anchored protein YhcB (DUF1043 family)